MVGLSPEMFILWGGGGLNEIWGGGGQEGQIKEHPLTMEVRSLAQC